MPQPPWPPVAYHGLYYEDAPASPFGRLCPKREPEEDPTPPSPHPETARIKGYLEQHFQHTQMDAERLNQLEARLENLGQRLEDLRGYL